ncbi:MAG: hypothetical protein JSV01_02370 [Desulfobacterales bacterium]|nr:MAG: hypothetical protein JSV01_02370 [Desulfobacterales bacterium]UCG80296.1 MAG: hypothetical protein JSV60_10080 [Desulfobacterales bacterium]
MANVLIVYATDWGSTKKMAEAVAGGVFPLVEGLKNEVICRENRIRDFIPMDLTTMQDAICTALAETEKGPGQLPSRQACFLH